MPKSINWKEFNNILENGSTEEFDTFLLDHKLIIKDGKIFPQDAQLLKDHIGYLDGQQHIRKISLNATYGSLLQANCRFFDKRIGQSTTLSGRQIVKHMTAKTNETLDKEYNYLGKSVIYNDTDSEIGSTIHHTSFGVKTIEQLFNLCVDFWENGDKEYAYHPDLMVMSYDPELNQPYLGHTNYIYRHKVTKDLYEIEDSLGNIVTVTEDHSVMIERNKILMECKPSDILLTDILISIKVNNWSITPP